MLEKALGVCMISVALTIANHSAQVCSSSLAVAPRFEW